MHTANMKWWQKLPLYVLAGVGLIIYVIIWPFVKLYKLVKGD